MVSARHYRGKDHGDAYPPTAVVRSSPRAQVVEPKRALLSRGSEHLLFARCQLDPLFSREARSLFCTPISRKDQHIYVLYNSGTMAPQRKRRFHASNDAALEAMRAREEQSIAECAELDLDDSPEIAESTKLRRQALMSEWKE